MHELPVPPAAEDDANARGLARIWAANGKQHVTMATGHWTDPGAWGIILVDLARHVANAYKEPPSYDREETLRRIRLAFDAEWCNPTDDAKGKLMD